MIVALAWFGTVIADREKLNSELVRVHIQMEQDQRASQMLQSEVRNAVINCLNDGIPENITDGGARQYILNQMQSLDAITESVLEHYDLGKTVELTFTQEAFYADGNDRLLLPSGVYGTLHIVVGEGKTWNCSDCELLGVWHCTGLSQESLAALPDEKEALRFHALDVLGQIENFLFTYNRTLLFGPKL